MLPRTPHSTTVLFRCSSGIYHIIEVAVAAGQDDDIARFRVARVGQDITRHAHIRAVLARQVEDRIDIRHHQARGRVVRHLSARGIDQWRQGAALAPRGVCGHFHQAAMRLRLGNEAFNQVIEIDDESLLVQAN